MKKKLIYILIGLIAALSLAACGSSKNANQPSGNPGDNPPQGTGEVSDTSKLAMGILLLEGTDNAVTSAQASTLQPLWEEIKTLISDQNASQDDLTADLDKVKAVLTDAQKAAIDKMTFGTEDIQALMDQYGIQGGRGNGDGGSMPTPDATQMAQAPAGQGQAAPQGTPPADMGTQPAGQGQGQGGPGGGGMGNQFVDTLISLLQERAAE